jgi:hypothetical protein
MKIQPSTRSANTLVALLPKIPVGTRVDLSVGGKTASIVKLDAQAPSEPHRFRTLVDGAMQYAPDPGKVHDVESVLKDVSVVYTAVVPGHSVGGVVECFAILSSTGEFAETIKDKKGISRISLAGAEVASLTLLVVHRSTWTIILAAVVNAINKLVQLRDKRRASDTDGVVKREHAIDHYNSELIAKHAKITGLPQASATLPPEIFTPPSPTSPLLWSPPDHLLSKKSLPMMPRFFLSGTPLGIQWECTSNLFNPLQTVLDAADILQHAPPAPPPVPQQQTVDRQKGSGAGP